MNSSACLKISKDPNLQNKTKKTLFLLLIRRKKTIYDEESPMCLPEKRGSNTEDHRASFMASVTTVVYVTYDSAIRGHQSPCSGGGHTQEEHSLTAEELSYTGAKDFTAISLSIRDTVLYKCVATYICMYIS